MNQQLDGWMKWMMTGLIAATLGSYGWATKAAWRVEDRATERLEAHEKRLETRLDRLEALIVDQFKRIERQPRK